MSLRPRRSTGAADGDGVRRSPAQKPSDKGGERAVSEALLIGYSGIQAPAPAVSVLSPNGDGVAETQQLAYKVVRPSTVNVALIGPDGVARHIHGAGCARDVPALVERPDRRRDGRDRGDLAVVVECHR